MREKDKGVAKEYLRQFQYSMSQNLNIVLGKKQYFGVCVFWFYPIDKEDILASVKMQKTSFWFFKTELFLLCYLKSA